MILVGGIDEAGRGPLAGPVTAGAVVFAEPTTRLLLKDSKQMSATVRDSVFDEIRQHCLCSRVVSVGPRRIEELNIRAASLEAMRLAALKVEEQLTREYQNVEVVWLVDGNAVVPGLRHCEAVVKGDRLLKVVSAASILAKVTRDRLMQVIAAKYPGYGLSDHKGYPTEIHRKLIAKKGPAVVHRRTFRGVREFV